MSPLLIGYLGVILVPLFVASWRLSLVGLMGQGLLLAWISYRLDPAVDTVDVWVSLVDFVVVRGLGAPIALYAVLRAQRASARNDVMPPNLMSWTLAIVLVLVAFRFADLIVKAPGDDQTFVAVATAALLLGFLVLATQTGPFSQMMGALRIENAIALFELGGPHDQEGLGLRIGQTSLVVTTILLFRWYLHTLPRQAAAKASAVEGPTS
ncbi:MAG: hycX [Myxococcales bacterium]|nr:hycX [Myxococcales bacterium]